LDHQFRGFVAAGVRDKSIAPCDPQLISFLITGGLAWISKWFDPNGAWSGDQVAEAMSVTYARMLSAEPVGKLPTNVSRLAPLGGLSLLSVR
jgi:TetR/AcrR family transcriptional regulator